MNPVPRYWWKMDTKNNQIVVHSDYPGGRNLAAFGFVEDADEGIAQAERLISDYRAGRATPTFTRFTGAGVSGYRGYK